jgi:hypothetical protein
LRFFRVLLETYFIRTIAAVAAAATAVIVKLDEVFMVAVLWLWCNASTQVQRQKLRQGRRILDVSFLIWFLIGQFGNAGLANSKILG